MSDIEVGFEWFKTTPFKFPAGIMADCVRMYHIILKFMDCESNNGKKPLNIMLYYIDL